MKLSRFIFIVVFLTIVSLSYVWQQSEIFCLAYKGQKRLSVYQSLAEKNAILKYCKQSNISLVRISDRLEEKDKFQIPETYRLVRLVSPQKNLKVGANPSRREGFLSRFFSVKRQAEARTFGN
jgi:hypothetical protein